MRTFFKDNNKIIINSMTHDEAIVGKQFLEDQKGKLVVVEQRNDINDDFDGLVLSIGGSIPTEEEIQERIDAAVEKAHEEDAENLQSIDIEITDNNSYTEVVADEDKFGLSRVGITTNVPEPNIYTDTMQHTVTENGIFGFPPPGDYDAQSMVEVTVEVPQEGYSLDLTQRVKFSHSGFTALPDSIKYANWSDVTDMIYMFYDSALEEWDDSVDTSNVTYFNDAFNGTKFTEIPNVNMLSAEFMDNMYANTLITTIPSTFTIPSNVTGNVSGVFADCHNLTTVEAFNLNNATSIMALFSDSENLTDVAQIDTSNITNMVWLFHYCPNLTNESLNNIMAMCINVSEDYEGEKTLFAAMGLDNTQLATCETLSNYDDFIAAGWTLGEEE